MKALTLSLVLALGMAPAALAGDKGVMDEAPRGHAAEEAASADALYDKPAGFVPGVNRGMDVPDNRAEGEGDIAETMPPAAQGPLPLMANPDLDVADPGIDDPPLDARTEDDPGLTEDPSLID